MLALAFFRAIWSRQITADPGDADTIFAEGEQGSIGNLRTVTDDAARPHYFDPVVAGINAVSTKTVIVLSGAASVWPQLK